MANSKIYFYECENPECGLRFPGSDGSVRGNRCPICRSLIHIVAEVNHPSQPERRPANHKEWHIEALLDNIRSAWNVGSILRTCDGFGIEKVHLCGITSSPENPKVSKTSLGAELNIPWGKNTNAVKTADYLKSKGYVIWALEDVPGAIPLYQLAAKSIPSPLVLTVGNEVSGVDPGILELSEKVISIPMLGTKQSYNVAVAFGVAVSFLLYLLSGQSFSQESLKIFPNM